MTKQKSTLSEEDKPSTKNAAPALNSLQTAFLWAGIEHCFEIDDIKLRLKYIRPHIYSFINALSEHKAQRIFASWQSKVHFIGQAYNLDPNQLKQLDALQRLLHQLKIGLEPHGNHFESAVSAFAHLVAYFSQTSPPASIEAYMAASSSESLVDVLPQEELLAIFFCLLETPPEILQDYCLLRVKHDLYGSVLLKVANVRFHGQDKLLYEYSMGKDAQRIQSGMRLCLTNVSVLAPRKIATTDDSLLILLPDYTIDASAVAAVYDSPVSFGLFLLKRMDFFESSLSAFKGILVNELFDRLIQNPEVSYKEALQQTLSGKILIDAAFFPKTQLQEAFSECELMFVSLQESLTKLLDKEQTLTTEPTFLSHIYGIQGRLDLLIEYPSNTRRKDIVELKSGSFPDERKKILAWPNHLAQVACYNLLIDSAFEDRRGISAVLYSKDSQRPIRDCGTLQLEIRRVLRVRNQLASMDWLLTSQPERVFEAFFKKMSESPLPSFFHKSFAELEKAWLNASQYTKAYFLEFVAFTMRELFYAKMGSNEAYEYRGGQAALWNVSAQDKKAAFELLDDLTIAGHEPEDNTVILTRHETALTALRVGDLVWLYPKNQGNKGQLIKGAVMELSAKHLKVRYWHKHISASYFQNPNSWAIEPSFLEQTYNQAFASLATFLKASSSQQNLLLGLEKPKTNLDFSIDYTKRGISAHQNTVLNAALAAQDYYLVVGPPGTGKTSAMLKNMLHYLYHETTENVVVLAFTNRATEEIADKAIEATNGDFIRLGVLETSHTHYAYTFQHEGTLKRIKEKIIQKRVFVGTVAGFFAYMRLADIKELHTLIVDEASQLLEPHLCGLLQYFKRFILIGDERQLPAVVTQAEQLMQSQNDFLKQIGLEHLNTSVFERLIKNANRQNWQHAFGKLKAQYRTHSRIADFYNQHFYGFLETGSAWQQENWSFFDPNSAEPLEQILAQDRLLFIPTPPEKHLKINQGQAELAVKIARFLKDFLTARGIFDAHSVGIIAPFRAQIAEIYSLFNAEEQACITVDTVERFQGSERDFIIMTTALNEAALLESIQALNEDKSVDRKLNVALSRAKKQFVLLGVPEVLKQSHFYNLLLQSAKMIEKAL